MPTFPKLTVITPSYNQAEFLERTIQSVINQNYPNLEYIVIDGGSTDGSVEVIRKYEKYLTYWISEPDFGQSHAINKGLKMATGDWVCWQNSDDIFYPSAFSNFLTVAIKFPSLDLIVGNMNLIDRFDNVLRDIKYVKPTYRSLLNEGMVLANQAAFWKRAVHHDLGFLDQDYDCMFDYDWFLRLTRFTRKVRHINATLAALRLHEETKTSTRRKAFMLEENKILRGRRTSFIEKKYFQMRRLVIMILQNQWRYVARGILKRVFHIKMKLF
jgi:glycosyltransferase involved in cell wall biosynthesis